MSPLLCLVTYLMGVFLGAALLAPPIYGLVQVLAEHLPVLEQLAQHPFHRYLNRCLLILGFGGLYLLFKGVGIRHWRDIGFARPIDWRALGLGFGLALGSLGLVALPALLLGARQLCPAYAPREYLLRAVEFALSAGAVACLEETLFRGALFGSLRKSFDWRMAAVLSSLFYAAMHFFHKPSATSEVQWDTGLITLAQMFTGLTQWHSILPGLLVICLIGLFLTLAYERTKTLYLSIGLHAGWVFSVKAHQLLFEDRPGAALHFWGSQKLVDGWLTLLILGVLLWWLWTSPWLRPATPQPAAAERGA